MASLTIPRISTSNFHWVPSSYPHPYSAFAPKFFYHLPFPPSPYDSGSFSSSLSELSLTPPPRPQSLHVICNAPLIAPKPLPYHSPTFLKFELLPDLDEDLSHPPYTQRPSKRKREDDDEATDFVLRKRRVVGTALPPRPASMSSRRRKPMSDRHPHRTSK